MRVIGKVLIAAFFSSISGLAICESQESPELISGQASVTAAGYAAYNIPIELPRSLAGFAPSLSISYSSANQTQSGLMGIGWTLNGLQQVTRCAQTIAQDGIRKAVSFTAGDRYCLNGQRLVVVNGQYGADGAEYRTEIDSIAKVVSYGTSGNGPQSFSVWTKDGQKYEFGNSVDSRLMTNSVVAGDRVKTTIVQAWALNKVTDRKGNYWTVSYDSLNANKGVIYPLTIEYTGNSGAQQGPNNKVAFEYEARPTANISYQFQAGSLISYTKRIKAVSTYVGQNKASEYLLTYQITQAESATAPAIHSRLEKIQECKYKGSVAYCLEPASLTWVSNETDFNVVTTGPEKSTAQNFNFSAPGQDAQYAYLSRPSLGDVSGDGKADMVFGSWKSNNGTMKIVTVLADGTVDSTAETALTGAVTTYAPITLLADINRDAKSDLVAMYFGSQGFQVYSWLSNGNGTFNNQPVIRNISTTNITPFKYGGWNPTVQAVFAKDVNNDGICDFVALADVATGVDAYVALGKPDGTTQPLVISHMSDSGLPWSNYTVEAVEVGDMSGDDVPDIVAAVYIRESTWGEYINAVLRFNGQGDGTFASTGVIENGIRFDAVTQAPIGGSSAGFDKYSTYLVDINRDGLLDLIFEQTVKCVTPSSCTGRFIQHAYVGLAQGNGGGLINRGGQTLGMTATGTAYSTLEPSNLMFHDFDGNGTIDMMQGAVGGSKSGGYFIMKGLWTPGLGNGDFANETRNFDLTSGSGQVALFAAIDNSDVQADGMVDFAAPYYWCTSTSDVNRGVGRITASVVDGVSSTSRKQQNLLSEIKRGNIKAAFKYAALPSSGLLATDPLYTMEYDAAYPNADLNMPLMVVSSSKTMVNDVVQDETQYRYKGAKADIANGRGFLGFHQVASTKTVNAKKPDGGIQTITREQLARYRQDFPFAGMPAYSSTKINGVMVEEIATTQTDFSVATPFSGVYQPQLNRTLTSTYDPESGALLLTKEQIQQFDPLYNNLTNSTSTVADNSKPESFVVTEANTYLPADIANWKVSLTDSHDTTWQRTGSTIVSLKKSFTYDADGFLSRELLEPGAASALQLQTDYGRDAYGNITSVTTSGTGDAIHSDTVVASRTTEMQYLAGADYPAGVFKTKEIRRASLGGMAQESAWTYDAFTGQTKTEVDPNGLQAAYERDALGRVTSQTKPGVATAITAYERCSSFASVGSGLTGCEVGEYLKASITIASNTPVYVFTDSYGRELRRVASALDGSSSYSITRTEYDEAGRVKRSSRPAFNTIAYGDLQWSAYEYDGVGRLKKESLPGGRITQKTYTGLTTSITNPLGKPRTEIRNAVGDLIEVRDAYNKSLKYGLDALGRVTKTTDAKQNQIVFTLDKLGRKIQQQDPDLGTWSYRYNALGELVWQQDAQPIPQETAYTYDFFGRLTSRLSPSQRAYWEYDSASNGKGKLYRALTKLSDGTVDYQRTHSYNVNGLPSSVSTQIGAGTSALQQSKDYDTQGRVSQFTYPGGVGYKNVYNTSTGVLKEVRDLTSNALYWEAQVIDAEGRVTQARLGNNVASARSYNSASGQLDTVQSGFSDVAGINARIQNDVYSFDSAGNLSARMEMLNNKAETFDYDDINRLVAVREAGNIVQSASYDEIGNIISRSDIGTYTYTGCNGTHRVCSVSNISGNFTYDGNGNQLSGNGNAYTWTSFNRPATISNSVSSQTFNYDPEQERVRRIINKSVNGVPQNSEISYLNPRLDLGGTFEREKRQDNSIVDTWHVYAGGSPIAAITKEGSTSTVRYLHTDHLGSVAVVTDNNGNVVERRSYNAWGQRRAIFGDDQATVSPVWQTNLSSAPTTANPNAAGLTMPVQAANRSLIQWVNNALVFDVRTNRKISMAAIGQTTASAQSNIRATAGIALSSTNPKKRYLSFGLVNSGSGAMLRRFSVNISGENAFVERCIGVASNGEPACSKSPLGAVTNGASYTVQILSTSSSALLRMYTPGRALNPDFVYAEAFDWTAGTSGLTKTLWMGASAKPAWLIAGSLLPIKGRASPIVVDDLAIETYSPATTLKGVTTRHGFTGHEMLDDQALVHMNGRVYDSGLGRFVSADPNIFYPENLQDFNRYSYVHNNPLTAADPDGFMMSSMSDSYLSDAAIGSALNASLMASINLAISRNINSGLNNISTGKFNLFGVNSTSGAIGQSESVSLFGSMFTGQYMDLAAGNGFTLDVVGGVDYKWASKYQNSKMNYNDVNAQHELMRATVLNAGVAAGKLTSTVEINAFNHYWSGSGTDVFLTPKMFNDVISGAQFNWGSAAPVTFKDGSQGMSVSITTYKMEDYDFVIGGATVYLKPGQGYVGFRDTYNFDASASWFDLKRTAAGEASTRAVNYSNEMTGGLAKPFSILYGLVP